jgi:hypothetical protein
VPFDHWLRESPDPKSPITCSVLRYTECSWCESLGHTKKYCPDFIYFLERKKEEEEEYERYKKEYERYNKERDTFQEKLEEEPQKTSAARTPERGVSEALTTQSVGVRGFACEDSSSNDKPRNTTQPPFQNVSRVMKKDIVPKNAGRVVPLKETPSKINDAEFPCLSSITYDASSVKTTQSSSIWGTFIKK